MNSCAVKEHFITIINIIILISIIKGIHPAEKHCDSTFCSKTPSRNKVPSATTIR